MRSLSSAIDCIAQRSQTSPYLSVTWPICQPFLARSVAPQRDRATAHPKMRYAVERVPRPACTGAEPYSAGDWLSGRAPRSHRGGHWFDPSIAHAAQRRVPITESVSSDFDLGAAARVRGSGAAMGRRRAARRDARHPYRRRGRQATRPRRRSWRAASGRATHAPGGGHGRARPAGCSWRRSPLGGGRVNRRSRPGRIRPAARTVPRTSPERASARRGRPPRRSPHRPGR